MPMSNYTFEDYKNAIKAKYEVEIDGEYSTNLSSPTPANLKKLCIKRFQSNNNKDDLNAFESFFDFPFDKDKKNLFGDDEMNKLQAVKRFLLGKTEKPAEDTIQLAAILVDLQPRPFNKFRKQIDEEDMSMYNELTNRNVPNQIVSSGDLVDEVKIENSTDSKETFDAQEPEPILSEESETIQDEEPKPTAMTISPSFPIDDNPKPNKWKYFAIIAVLFGLGLITYFNLSKKECIQWSGNHYEEVSCDLKIQGIGTFNSPEPYDERIINLRRIKVSDTTTFFRNEKAIIWYAKVGDSIQFFNTHGMHPETGRALKPITSYIINKYVRK
ncbi:hypothetical protein [Flavobacterium quisquiliarum]|uniref:Uncharacterized protein n=1 Tax=Flavobacterium quisquiliarum TaxID=1834436 RepID=A0ABV8WC53_9FLAO|nr:hypothetical protein [Flavobacterium quisquiliarum]MBW1655244.1 hypothetical protein [Flavobacterium quisquiliarum]